MGAVLGSVGAGLFLKSAFDDAREFIRVQAQLEAVLKSTGGAAGITAEHIEGLAQSQQKLGIADDETTKRGAALLLTFKEVRNEAGKNNDVFDRTLKASQDLSAALGVDLQTSIIQVGKALQDPAVGLTALRRVGVSFTAQEREQIKTLIEHGDLLKAQKIILSELETQFGGTAAAIAKADPFQRFGIQLHEFKEQVGRDLLPVVEDVLNVGGNIADAFGAAPGPIRATAEATVALGVGAVGLSRGIAAATGLRAALFGVAEGEEAAAVAGVTLGGALSGIFGVIATAAGSFGITTALLDHFFGSHHTDAEQLANDVARVAESIRNVEERSGLGKLLNLKDEKQAATDIDDLNAHFAQLISDGNIPKARKEYGDLVNSLLAQGVPIREIADAFTPYLDALARAQTENRKTATSADDVVASFQRLANANFTPRLQELGVQDAISSARDALGDLNDARREAHGLGPKSQAAADAEAQAIKGVGDAMRSARDASERLGDAQRSLADAQAKLAEFDNPVSQTIRSLERTQITEREVTTPEEVRQKSIDLLRFDQQNADERAGLQKGIADAQRQVADAEQGVADAALKVGDAQAKVAEAAEKRRQVQVDAATAIKDAERKAEEAVLSAGQALSQFAQDADPGRKVLRGYLEALDDIAHTLDPSGALAKNLDVFLFKLAGTPQAASAALSPAAAQAAIKNSAATQTANINQVRAGLNPTLLKQVDSGKAPVNSDELILAIYGADQSTFTRTQLDFLHRLGVPGFAFGGIVPGPIGAPRLIVAHGGEKVQTPAQQNDARSFTVTQENHFHGGDRPTKTDLDYANRDLGWRIARFGRRA